MSYSRKELVNAMMKYNTQLINNPDNFDELDETRECAEEQVDYLISLVDPADAEYIYKTAKNGEKGGEIVSEEYAKANPDTTYRLKV